MQNEWIRADRMQPEYGQRVLMSVRGTGLRIGSYEKKRYVHGGYFRWIENEDEEIVEDDMAMIAWRDLPEEYNWGCE